ncbi:HD-GYP domain-containing protein [Streptomyces sp. PR69]|uniref:HD-GYP domain-containing protein n=1 Tax=Streptomyces sp. PR69 TaxID=2984950 RepID=UPI003A5C5819
MPRAAYGCVAAAVLCAAALCLASLPDALADALPALLTLAALHALCEISTRRQGRPGGVFLPVLFAAAFLLPPAAAALVVLPGALLGRVARRSGRPAELRRVWRAARLALAAWAAAQAFTSLRGGHALRDGRLAEALTAAAAAVLVCCLALAVLDCVMRAAAERQPVRTAWRGLLSAALPSHAVHGLTGLLMALLWHGPHGPMAAVCVLPPLLVSCRLFAASHQERAAHHAAVRALVQAVDIKDRYTRGHGDRVGQASALIGHELKWDERRLELLRFAGVLHDVGKLGVPTRVLRKDGPLTEAERRMIELHPEYGHEVVRGIGFLGEARSAVLHHHERMDGSGYPYGLAGRQIPEFARVVAVADAFDAMTSTRSYRRARPVAEAVAELERCAGTQFDPRMVRALVRALRRHGWHPEATAEPAAETAAGTTAAYDKQGGMSDLRGNVSSERPSGTR